MGGGDRCRWADRQLDLHRVVFACVSRPARQGGPRRDAGAGGERMVAQSSSDAPGVGWKDWVSREDQSDPCSRFDRGECVVSRHSSDCKRDHARGGVVDPFGYFDRDVECVCAAAFGCLCGALVDRVYF